MTNPTPSDTELLHFLQSSSIGIHLPSRQCSRYLLPQSDNVSVIRIGDKSHFRGLQTCQSVWGCPVCSFKNMERHRQNIALAIEALNRMNYSAAMITLTIPHLRAMSLFTLVQILNSAWKKFWLHFRSPKHQSALNKIHRECGGLDYRVRVVEVTHGVNGWHPHIHALIWVKSECLNQLTNYEADMLARWNKCVIATYEELCPRFAEYARLTCTGNASYRPLHISRDDKGNVRKQLSSMYLSGWQADRELTGNVQRKASHDGHRTPYQILVDAYNGDAASLQLFKQFAIEMRGFNRVKSTSKLTSVVKRAKLTEAYNRVIAEKKSAEEPELIITFTKQQWYEILCSERASKVRIRTLILRLALLDDPRRRIIDFLSSFNIEVSEVAATA